MKTKRLIPILCLPALLTPAFAIKPKTDTTNKWVRITDVERTDSGLRMGVRLQHYANYWVKIPSSTRLIADGDTSIQFKLKGSENIQIDKKIWMPSTGFHEGVLIFEPVPESVKVVDMVEDDPNDIKSSTLGIRIDEPDNSTRPKVMTLQDILKQRDTGEAWDGLDPTRYADMAFYKKDGTAHLSGKITDYSPRYGISTFTLWTQNDYIENEQNNLGHINPDGTFEIDVPLSYPNLCYFELGNIRKNFLLIPGDTISITASLAQKADPLNGSLPEHLGYSGTITASATINLLKDSLLDNRYGLSSLYGRYHVSPSDTMTAKIYRSHAALSGILDSVVADLPKLLKDIPVSGFTKDMLSSIAIGTVAYEIENLELDFRLANSPRPKIGKDGTLVYDTVESLNREIWNVPFLRHKDLIYDNPLIAGTTLALPNRWTFNGLFRASRQVAEGYEAILDDEGNDTGIAVSSAAEDLPTLYRKSIQSLDSIGIGNCFAAQMVRTASLIDGMKTTGTPSYDNLEYTGKLLSQLIRHNNYEVLNDLAISDYNNYVKDVLIAEGAFAGDTAIMIPDSPEGDVLAKIIAPYKGNVLFLDFWGIGCGPCRAGMRTQKPLLEKLADKPFKALYIANADDGLDGCKKWLRNEGIQGEHIFVSGDDWKRLCSLFNFTGIPHGVLIGKDGTILKNGIYIEHEENLLHKALSD